MEEGKIINMKIRILLIIFVFVFSFNSPISYSGDFEEMVSDLQKKFEKDNFSKDEILQLLMYIEDVMGKIQVNFSEIASNITSDKKKQELIKHTIDEYFLNSSSMVYTSSLFKRSLESFTIDEYFKRLSSVYYGRYTKVEIYFEKNYLKMGEIQPYDDKYEFDVEAWQVFKGYKGDNIKYNDATLKVFGFIFFKDKKTGYWVIKVKRISAKPPITVDDFNKVKKTWNN